MIVQFQISNTQGQPIPGANVFYSSSPSIGTSTDANGYGEIEIIGTDLLEITALGYEAQQIEVGEVSAFNISMVESITELGTATVTAAAITEFSLAKKIILLAIVVGLAYLISKD